LTCWSTLDSFANKKLFNFKPSELLENVYASFFIFGEKLHKIVFLTYFKVVSFSTIMSAAAACNSKAILFSRLSEHPVHAHAALVFKQKCFA